MVKRKRRLFSMSNVPNVDILWGFCFNPNTSGFGCKLTNCFNGPEQFTPSKQMPNIRPLNEALAKKAELELSETPDKIESGLASIREWLTKQPHLTSRTDDQFLVAFLRCCKFSVERVKEKLDLYYSARAAVPTLVQNADPMDPLYQKILKNGCYYNIPRPNEPDAPVTNFVRPSYDTNEVSLNNIIEFGLMVVDYFLVNSDNVTIAGQEYVYDLSAMSMPHILQFTPTALQCFVLLFTRALPLRFRSLHFVNFPSTFMSLFSSARMLLPEKIKSRMHLHKTLDDFYKHFDREDFPQELGGNAGPESKFIDKTIEMLTNARDELLANRQYGVDESKRIGKSECKDWGYGVDGTFRKLAVD